MTVWGTPNIGNVQERIPKSTLGEYLGASAEQAFDDSPMPAAYRANELAKVEAGDDLGGAIARVQAGEDPADAIQARAPAMDLPISAAKAKIKEAGLEPFLHLPDQPAMASPVLDIMMERAEARKKRAGVIERGPSGIVPTALFYGTSFLVSAVDPLNIASAFIPVVGEMRYANMLANAGESLLARGIVRTKLGAVEGAVGQAIVEPLTARAQLQEGQDYTAGEALRSLMFGGLFGAGLHVGAGGGRDLYRARRGEAQYPYNIGEPLEFHTPWDDLQAARPAAAASPDLPILSEKYPGPLPRTEAPATVPAPDAEAGRPISLANLSEENPVRIDDETVYGTKWPDNSAVVGGRTAFENARQQFEDAGMAPEEAVAHAAMMASGGPAPGPAGGQPAVKTSLTVAGRQIALDVGRAAPTAAEFKAIYPEWKRLKHRMEIGDLTDAEWDRLDVLNKTILAKLDAPRNDNAAARRPAPVLEALADLPRQVQEDVMRAAIASVTSGEPVRVMEMLEAAAKTDPRIAESMRLMETRGQGLQFHGTSAAELQPSSEHYSTKSYYGQGFYTTDAVDIAHGYSKRGAAKTGERNLFKIEERRPLKIYDAEQPIDADLIAKITPDPKSMSALDDVVDLALSEKPKNLRELYDEIRDIGTAEGHSADTIQEIFDAINYNLREAGFDGMSHTGGLRTDKPAHRVVIYFNPESDLTVNKGSFHDFVQAEPEAAAANVVRGPKSARGPRARDERTYSLIEFLAHNGGLRPDPELAVIFGGKNPFVPGFGRLIRDTGMTLDRAREASVHASYLAEPNERVAADAALPQTRPSETTPSDLLKALDEEARGSKQYRNDYLPDRKGADRDEHLRHLDAEFTHALREADVDPQSIPDKQRARVIQMMEREGEKDPLVAWERAVMEEGVDVLENSGRQRSEEQIPGWDVPDVGGPAPVAGRAAAPGRRDGFGGPARGAGDGHREAPSEADWRQLAEGRRPENEPDAIAASRAADALPEPGSISTDPSKRVAAAEKAATEADALYAEAEAFLPEELRLKVESDLKKLADDTKDSTVAISKGAACLAAAFA